MVADDEEGFSNEYGHCRVPDLNFKSKQLENEELNGFVCRLTLDEALRL